MLQIFDKPLDQSVQTITFKQHIHVLSYACFFKRTLLCFQLNLCLLPPFWVGWMSICTFVFTVHVYKFECKTLLSVCV